MTVPPAPWPAGTLLARLSGTAREDLLSRGTPIGFSPGRPLLLQGDPGATSHVLLGGLVKETAIAENGTVSLIDLRGPGDLLGEAVVVGTAQPTTVVAVGQVWTRVITRHGLTAFLEANHDAWQPITQMINDRLEWANRRRMEFAGYDVPTRLARMLCELARRFGTGDGDTLTVRLSQDDLAALIGASTEAVAKAVGRLRREALIRPRYRAVTILDPERLADYAGLSPATKSHR